MKFKTLLKGISLLILLVFFGSCGSNKKTLEPSTNTVKTVTIEKRIHDTIFNIVADSSSYKALIECQNGNAVIKKVLNETSGKNSLEPPKVTLENNQLNCDCEARELALRAQWESENRIETIEVEKIVPEYHKLPLTFFETFQIWCGRVFIFLIIACVVISILRWKKIV